MTNFALVWILIASNSTFQSYSPPVKTQEQCIAMQKSVSSFAIGRCVQVEILVNK